MRVVLLDWNHSVLVNGGGITAAVGIGSHFGVDNIQEEEEESLSNTE
jgi:hypothetical protein